MLGRDYAGYFPVEDDGALAKVLLRAERDEIFRARLASQCAARRALMTPAAEQAALARVVAEPVPGG